MILMGRVDERDEPSTVTIGGVSVAEVLVEYAGRRVWAAWAVGDGPIKPSELASIAAAAADGLVDATYTPHYSEITGYLWTDEEGWIGGHNLVAHFAGETPYARLMRNPDRHVTMPPPRHAVLAIGTRPLDLLALPDPQEGGEGLWDDERGRWGPEWSPGGFIEA